MILMVAVLSFITHSQCLSLSLSARVRVCCVSAFIYFSLILFCPGPESEWQEFITPSGERVARLVKLWPFLGSRRSSSDMTNSPSSSGVEQLAEIISRFCKENLWREDASSKAFPSHHWEHGTLGWVKDLIYRVQLWIKHSPCALIYHAYSRSSLQAF